VEPAVSIAGISCRGITFYIDGGYTEVVLNKRSDEGADRRSRSRHE